MYEDPGLTVVVWVLMMNDVYAVHKAKSLVTMSGLLQINLANW